MRDTYAKDCNSHDTGLDVGRQVRLVQDQSTLGVAAKRELGVGAAGGQASHETGEVVGASSNSYDTIMTEASQRSVATVASTWA